MAPGMVKVRSGDPLEIPADTYNAFVDAALANKAAGQFPSSGGINMAPRPGLVWVKNVSAAAISQFSPMVVTGTVFSPATELLQFVTDPLLTVNIAAANGSGGRLAMLQDPIAPGGIGRAIISGACVAYVNVIATTDQYADVTSGHCDYLTSGPSGPFVILSALTATGQQWVAGKIGGGAAADFWAVITGNTVVLADRQWTYTVQAMTGKTVAGYGASAWGHAAPDIEARNTFEYPNASGATVLGNGVPVANLRGLTPQPIPSGLPVLVRSVSVVVSGTASIEYWFGVPNGLGGTCTP